jgi:hypothetical protein
MTWTSKTSSPEDTALENAWDELNQALDRRVPVSIQMRVTACVADTLTFVTLLRSLEADEISRSDALEEKMEEWAASDKRRAPTAEWDSHSSFQFVAAVKATYYFVRALQDAVYAALLEASGQRAGAYPSMYNCAKNARNPIHVLIEQAIPDYFTWFADFRAVRNQLKLGASTAFGYQGGRGAKQVQLILQEIDDSKRHVSQGREISLVDIENCLTQSRRLMKWAAEFAARCGLTSACS